MFVLSDSFLDTYGYYSFANISRLTINIFTLVLSGYIVEKCEEGAAFWEKVPGVISGTAHVVKDLELGKKYKFRVKAENVYGVSDPVETDRAILAKNPYGREKTNFLTMKFK